MTVTKNCQFNLKPLPLMPLHEECTLVIIIILAGVLAYRTNEGFGPGSGLILLDDVECTGLESRLWNCGHRGLEVHDCSHYQDAEVVCRTGKR